MPAGSEGCADVAVDWPGATRPIGIGKAHVADREAQLVQPPEDAGERRGGVLVDDELAGVQAAVEPPVGDGEERSRASGTGQPGCQRRPFSSALSGAGRGWIEVWNATSTSGNAERRSITINLRRYKPTPARSVRSQGHTCLKAVLDGVVPGNHRVR